MTFKKLWKLGQGQEKIGQLWSRLLEYYFEKEGRPHLKTLEHIYFQIPGIIDRLVGELRSDI